MRVLALIVASHNGAWWSGAETAVTDSTVPTAAAPRSTPFSLAIMREHGAGTRRARDDDSDAESFDFETLGTAVKLEGADGEGEEGDDLKPKVEDAHADTATGARAGAAAAKEPKISRTTLFVRNVPFDASSDELAQFFSEIGPTRNCFVVSARQKRDINSVPVAVPSEAPPETPTTNRGIGFVQFALPEDAQRAIDKLKDVKFRGVRKLKLDFAQSRHAQADRESRPAKPPPVPKPARSSSAAVAAAAAGTKPNPPSKIAKPHSHLNSILVFNLSSIPNLTKNHLRKKLRKYGELVELEFPLRDVTGGTSSDVARATFPTPTAARNAATRLTGHVFKGAVIKVVLEERPDTGNRGKGREARLVVRNLPFSFTEPRLRDLFSPYGTLSDVNLPLKPSSDGASSVTKGFAFVEFSTREEAERAIEEVNGTLVAGRTVVVDWAVSKKVWELEVQRELGIVGMGMAGGDGGKMEVDEEVKEEENDEDASVKEESDGEDEDEDEDEEKEVKLEDLSDGSDQEDGIDRMDEDGTKSQEDEDGDGVKLDGSSGGVKRKRSGSVDDGDGAAAPKLSPEEERERLLKKRKAESECTVFVKNLAFETGEEDLEEKFRHFGNIRYVRITRDRLTGRSRGTAFVRFFRPADCERCIADYAAAAATMAADQPDDVQVEDKRKRGPPKPASVLNPEPSMTASSTPFFLHGRSLVILPIVTRVQASALSTENKRKKRGQDKRNLYLAREGVIFADSPVASELTPAEVSKRQTSYAERKRLLERNPNLYVSRTRLSLRNLWVKLNDGDLRKLCKEAVDAFWNEWRGGTRKGVEREVLEEDELLDPIDVGEYDEADPSKLPPDVDPSTIRRPKVLIKQAKVIRDTARADPTTGLGRSKGYAFVEFSRHSDALACLRWLNNNPQAYVSVAAEVNARELAAAAPEDAKKAAAAANAKGKKNKGKGKEQTEAADTETSERRSAPTKRPIVEFSIENSLVLKKREERLKRPSGPKSGDAAAGPSDGSANQALLVRKKGRKKMSLLERIKEKKLRKKLEGEGGNAQGQAANKGASPAKPQPKSGKKGQGESSNPREKRKRDDVSRESGEVRPQEKRRKVDSNAKPERAKPAAAASKPRPELKSSAPPTGYKKQQQQQSQQPSPSVEPKKKEKARPGLSKEQKKDLQEDREFDGLVAKYRHGHMSLPTIPSALACGSSPALIAPIASEFRAISACLIPQSQKPIRLGRRSFSSFRKAPSLPTLSTSRAHGRTVGQSCVSITQHRSASALPPVFSEWLEWHNAAPTQMQAGGQPGSLPSEAPEFGEPVMQDTILHPFMKHTSVDLPQHADILRQLTSVNPFSSLPNLSSTEQPQQSSESSTQQPLNAGQDKLMGALDMLFQELEIRSTASQTAPPDLPSDEEVFAPGIAKRREDSTDIEPANQYKHIPISHQPEDVARIDTLAGGVTGSRPSTPLPAKHLSGPVAGTVRPSADIPLPPGLPPYGGSSPLPVSRTPPITPSTSSRGSGGAPPTKEVNQQASSPGNSNTQETSSDPSNSEPPAPPSSPSPTRALAPNPLSHPRDTLLDLLQLPSLTVQDRQLISSALSGRSTRVWETVGGWVVAKYAGALAAERSRRVAAAVEADSSRPRPPARKPKRDYHKRPKGVPSTLATLLKYQEVQKAREEKERRSSTIRASDADDNRWDDRED
ncbi:hypothetical protein M427DRAFT_28735 [Gonapodya prolifera JEL478]|uniref:RRM domain-containing protein n=1 Tax=Gonapodya prolifera (strain JEL478) TaxID=1344416 RepID=A0A139ASY6_GONPJ|nr:hypothetical protein M427DRAFT_28735 [Gonapodya prolifera JEL478]|eukprot:KXS19840.1 hypothetical protein M427DRAFT_28735 [Gonapodya prolifera JEL478]